MKRKNYPLWIRIPGAMVGAVLVCLVGVGAIVLLVKFLSMLGARVNP